MQSHDVPIYLRGVGTVIAYNKLLVRSQITGQLVKISFHQGQQVKKGATRSGHCQSRPRPGAPGERRDGPQSLHRSRQAKIDRATARQLAKGIVDQLVAMIKSDEAIIESARVNLGYTNLASPIDGVTGIRQIDIGNVIHSTDVNGLVDVTQIEPIPLILSAGTPSTRNW